MAVNQDGSAGTKRKRGFASMDPAQQREIARQGGRAAHRKGVAHQFTSEEAREAGRIGGQHSHGGRGARFGSNSESSRGNSGGNSAETSAPAAARSAPDKLSTDVDRPSAAAGDQAGGYPPRSPLSGEAKRRES